MSSVNLLSMQVYAFGQAGCNPPQKPDEVKQYIDDLGSKDQKNGWRIRLKGEESLSRVLRSNERLEKKINIINELLKNLTSGDYEKRKAIIRILVVLLRSEKSDSPLFSEASLRQRIADSFIRIFDQSAWGIKELLVSGLSTLVKKRLSDELISKSFFLLIASAKSDNWRIRIASIESLCDLFKSGLITLNLQRQIKTRKNEVIPALIAIIKNQHSVGFVKFEVVKLSIKLGARKQAIPALMVALKDIVRLVAAKALGELKAREAIPTLIAALKYDNESVREVAAKALGELKAREAIPALIAALKYDNESVRKVAAKALGELKAREAIPALIAALKDKDTAWQWLVKYAVAEALGELKAREAIPALIAALKDKDYESISVGLVVALSKMKESIPALIVVFKDGDSYIRLAVVAALSMMREAIPALITALKNGDDEIRYAVVEMLRKLKGREAISAFLKNTRWAIRPTTMALGELNIREAIPALIAALRNDIYSSVRLAAAEALRELKAREAIPALIVALRDDIYSNVRKVAGKTLGELKTRESIPALIAALKDTEWQVRLAAAEVLGELKGRETVPALIAALKDDNESVRKVAVKVLSKMKESIPALITALKNGDNKTRYLAAVMLGKLKAKEAIPALTRALKKDTWTVRQAAAEALMEITVARVVPSSR